MCLPARSRIVSAKQRAKERQQTERGEESKEALIDAAQPGMEERVRELQKAGM